MQIYGWNLSYSSPNKGYLFQEYVTIELFHPLNLGEHISKYLLRKISIAFEQDIANFLKTTMISMVICLVSKLQN